jgi:hypothetical protein
VLVELDEAMQGDATCRGTRLSPHRPSGFLAPLSYRHLAVETRLCSDRT